MSDAAIVGIVGIFAATVLGPLIAYHVRKDEDSRRETIATLDGAVDALTTARGTSNWLRSLVDRPTWPTGIDADLRRGLDDIYKVEAYATRLHLRLGQGAITEAYTEAAVALTRVAAHVHDVYTGCAAADPEAVDRDVSAAERFTMTFIDEARRWHENHLGQA